MSTSEQGSPIPADEQSVDIDVGDVDYEQTYAPEPTTTTSMSKRSLELTDIEGSFKRGVTSALHQRPLFVLDKADITPSDATAFQLQATRWNDNFALNEVIVGRAVDLVQICIYADNAFTMLSEVDMPRWLELLTVPQAAELVIKYFGPRPDSGRTLAENFGNVSFDFSFLDPAPERTTMMAYIELVHTHEQLDGPLTSEHHAHLITLIEKRLPPDSQIRADYFTAKKGRKPGAPETWDMAMHRLLRCIGDVRTSIKKNESYGDPSKVYHYLQTSPRHTSDSRPSTPGPSTSRLPALARRSAPVPAAPLVEPVCASCGHRGHARTACPYRYNSDANNDLDSSWADSYLGRKWLSHGHSQYEVDLVLPGFEERYSINTRGLVSSGPSASSSSSSKHARFDDRVPREDNRRKAAKPNHYQPGQSRCKSPTAPTSVSAPLLSTFPDDYLPVTIFLNQTEHLRGTTPTKHRVEAGALLDTGSLAGDFLSQHVVTQLQGDSFCYTAPHPTTVCSGLDSTCYDSLRLVDIGILFLTHDKIKKTIFLTVSVNPSTSIDLILGRHTLTKFDLFSLTPHALGIPRALH